MPSHLSAAEQKQVQTVIDRARGDRTVPHSAQESIPFQRMFPDGICRVTDNYYTKTIQFQDINYQLAQQEDQTAIFEEWCSFLNFFDSSIRFELSFMNMASLSVSDIVALRQNGVVSCHYVDSIGFQELPGFLKPENYLKAAEMAMEDDYGMIDGVINNGKKEEPVEKASVLDQLKEKQEAVPPASPRRCCEEKEL